jgi:threonine dehydrogenase-like Zn-dependent dehydrogenase
MVLYRPCSQAQKHIRDEHAALVEILSIGFHAISRAGLGKNDDLLIFGCGKVGQSILQAAKTVTTGKIFMADILDKRLAMASLAYPDIHTINITKTDPAEYIREATNGKGVDIAIEAVGHFHPVEGKLNPIRSCIRAIKGGGTVCVLGLGDEPSEVLMKELIWKEARIIASRVSHGEFATAIEALAAGKLKPEKMITGILNLEDAHTGFELLEKSPAENLKIMLKV